MTLRPIYLQPLFQIFTQSIDAIDVRRITLSHLNSVNAIDVTRVECQTQMPNVIFENSTNASITSAQVDNMTCVLFGMLLNGLIATGACLTMNRV